VAFTLGYVVSSDAKISYIGRTQQFLVSFCDQVTSRVRSEGKKKNYIAIAMSGRASVTPLQAGENKQSVDKGQGLPNIYSLLNL
jgi:hypothetical protein